MFLRNTDGANIIRWAVARLQAISWLQVVVIGQNPESISPGIPRDLRSRTTLLAPDNLISMTILFSTIRRAASHRPPQENSASVASMSPRQREILSLITKGYSNHVIAESLHLSEKTVENQINVLYHKLGLSQHDPNINVRVMAAHLGSAILLAPREPQGA